MKQVLNTALALGLLLGGALANAETAEEQTDIRAQESFVATCPDKFLTYFDKSEGGPGAYCACPDENISYIDKSEGGPGFYCAE